MGCPHTPYGVRGAWGMGEGVTITVWCAKDAGATCSCGGMPPSLGGWWARVAKHARLRSMPGLRSKPKSPNIIGGWCGAGGYKKV